jgi:putative ABC transport system ATP-binding protein
LKIAIKNITPLSFEYNQKEDSIWGFNNTLESPGVYKVIASSGSGKSTLISILSGLRLDYAGDIEYGQQSIRHYSPKDWSVLRSQKISLVYQDLRLFPNLTVRENILLSQDITGADYNNVMTELEGFAKEMNISNQLDKLVKHLSFGQMQRVAIIRAMMRNYEWLILDEPFSHLDLTNATIAWDLITQQAKIRNAGIIIACLDPYEFIKADKIFHL